MDARVKPAHDDGEKMRRRGLARPRLAHPFEPVLLEHISVWVNRGDSQGNLDGRVFGDRFGILETIDVEALFFGPA